MENLISEIKKKNNLVLKLDENMGTEKSYYASFMNIALRVFKYKHPEKERNGFTEEEVLAFFDGEIPENWENGDSKFPTGFEKGRFGYYVWHSSFNKGPAFYPIEALYRYIGYMPKDGIEVSLVENAINEHIDWLISIS